MATATRKCKICGCEYEYCHTAKRTDGVFRWQDVACCVEHGAEYLAKVMASRNGYKQSETATKVVTDDITVKETEIIETAVDDIVEPSADDNIDYNIESDFDDDEDDEDDWDDEDEEEV